MDAHKLSTPQEPQFKDRLWSLITSPYAWGGAATYVFYLSLPHLPVQRELAERYLASHPIQYAQTALFFVGLSVLVHKLLQLRLQRAALRTCILQAATSSPTSATASRSAALTATLEGWAAKLPPADGDAWITGRLAEIRQYLGIRPTAEALESQLKDLERRADDELHESFAPLQTIHWAIPIMGLLGTVLGVAFAFFQLDANELQASLGGATANLATSFDTTALALCYVLVLLSSARFVRGAEAHTLGQVGSFCRRHVLPLMPADQAQAGPFVEAETEAARQLVSRTGQLIESQTQLWSESVETMRNRWSATLATQQQSLTESLQAGTQSTLQQHSEQLATLRREFSKALEQLSQQRNESETKQRAHEVALAARWEAGTSQLANVLGAAQQAADERTSRMLTELSTQFSTWCRQLQTTTDALQQRLTTAEHASDERSTRLLSELSTQVTGWKSQLQAATGSLSSHVERLAQHESRVCDLLDRGNDIHSLEEKLTQNLQACLLYTSPSPRDGLLSRMPSSA